MTCLRVQGSPTIKIIDYVVTIHNDDKVLNKCFVVLIYVLVKICTPIFYATMLMAKG